MSRAGGRIGIQLAPNARLNYKRAGDPIQVLSVAASQFGRLTNTVTSGYSCTMHFLQGINVRHIENSAPSQNVYGRLAVPKCMPVCSRKQHTAANAFNSFGDPLSWHRTYI